MGLEKEFNKKQSLVFDTQPLEFRAMGDKLVRVTCYLLGTGINRNRSNITKEAVIKANAKLPHLPVVGHLIKDDDGSYYLGGHDIKIEDKGRDWEITPLTVPLGCIAGDKEFEFVEITEETTGVTRDYLKVDMILWNHMSSVMEAAYSREVYFNHSIEIDDVKGEFDETNNFRIDSFTYHAACLLGLGDNRYSPKHVEPCFPESKVYPVFACNDDFNKQFALLLNEINKFNMQSMEQNDAASDEASNESTVETNEQGVTGEKKNEAMPAQEQNKNNEEEVAELGEILFSEVCAKIKEQVGGHTFRFRTGKQYDKYIVLSICESDKAVIVIDREAEYAAFKVPYLATQTKADGLIVNIDFENKTPMQVGAVDKTESVFRVSDEVSMIASDSSEYDVSVHNTAEITAIKNQLAAMTENYEAAQEKIAKLDAHLAVFEREKKQFMEQKHKDIIDALIASRREDMGKYSEFLEYCINMDEKYAKTVEEVEQELKEIHYNFMLKTQPQPSGKKHFGAIDVSVVNSTGLSTEDKAFAERYGANNLKYFKN